MEALVCSSRPCCHLTQLRLLRLQGISHLARHWDIFRQTRGKPPNVDEVIAERRVLIWSSATSEQGIHMYVALFTLYQQNIGRLWNANKLPPLPAKACSRLDLPKCTILLFRQFHYHWQAKLTEIWRFSLGLPMENNLGFSFVLLLLKFQVSSRYPLLSPFIMKSIHVFTGQSQSCAASAPCSLIRQHALKR